MEVLVGLKVAVVAFELDAAEELEDDSVVVLPLEVAISATTIPIAKTLAIAMTVFALVLM